MNNENFISALRDLDFTIYEAKVFDVLIKYNILSAREIHKYSGVPQPKIYETTVKLHQKGLISIIHKKKKLFMIKPKEVIQEILQDFSKKVQEKTNTCIKTIDDFYNTEEAEDIPFLGVAGEEAVSDYIYTLTQNAKKSINSFFPLKFFDKKIISLLARRSKEIDINIFLLDEDLESEFLSIPSQISFYKLVTPAFDIIKQMISNIEKMLPPDQQKAFTFKIIKDIGINIKEIFGIILIDEKKTFFKIPLPVETPMVITSTLPELVEFHLNGLNAIFASSKKIQ